MPRRSHPRRHRARRESVSQLQPDYKVRGEIAELAFAHRAASLGLIVSKPYGDSAPYDFVVEGNGVLRRVQVKSASAKDGNTYHINAGYGASNKRRYRTDQIDVLAAHVVPEDAWYLIPRAELGGRKTIRVAPHVAGRRRGFERWRERWSVLGAEEPEIKKKQPQDPSTRTATAPSAGADEQPSQHSLRLTIW